MLLDIYVAVVDVGAELDGLAVDIKHSVLCKLSIVTRFEKSIFVI